MTFDEVYASRPDKKGVGSSGYSNMWHLYHKAMELQPNDIIESGIWKGNGSFALRYGWPQARFYGFDIDLSNRQWINQRGEYFENDITSNLHILEYGKILSYFDDHINQEQRLHWAHKMGFKWLLFDDNVTEKEAKKLKNPPVPTLDMIRAWELPFVEEYEILENLRPDERNTKLTWVKLT